MRVGSLKIKVCRFYFFIISELLLVIIIIFFYSPIDNSDHGMDGLVGRALRFDIRSPACAATSGRGRRILVAEPHAVVAVPVVDRDRLRHRTRRYGFDIERRERTPWCSL